MPAFSYKALASSGSTSEGEIEAMSRDEAYRRLLSLELKPISISTKSKHLGTSPQVAVNRRASGRLNAKRLVQFTEELAVLLDAGLQLEPALAAIENREENSPVKSVAADLRVKIREGKSFSGAMREMRGVFSDLYINMISAGEVSGALSGILHRQALHTSVVVALQKRVTMAFIYPSIVFATGVVLLGGFMVFLLPQLINLLSKTGRELPLVTRLLIGTNEFLVHYWWVLFLGIGIVFFAHRVWVSGPQGKSTWHRILLQLPLIGLVLKQQFLAQFLQTLSTLLVNGVALLSALQLAGNATANLHARAILARLADQVGEGMSLTQAMRKSGFFPAVLVDIVSVGERTGKIGPALQRGAVLYDKEFNERIDRFTLLIQPITILLVALFVGLISYSMITGILTTVSGLRMR